MNMFNMNPSGLMDVMSKTSIVVVEPKGAAPLLYLPMDKLGLPAVTVPAAPAAGAGPVIEPAATSAARDFVRSGRNLEGAR